MILADEVIQNDIQAKKPTLITVKDLLKFHKKECLEVLAYLNMEDPETFKPSLIELPKMLIEVLQDEEVIDLFQSQGQMKEDASFGSATENIEETEEV